MGRPALFLLALCCVAQPLPDLRPETVLLAEVRKKMLYLLENQPNYTCLETVERLRQLPGGGQQVQDTLRLEVALVDDKEMFAWPGATEFEDMDLRDLVATGMFGNGNYAIYTRILFLGNGPAFVFQEETTLNGAKAARYDFRVPRARSGYHLRVDKLGAVTGFRGSIYLDPEKADLKRIEIVAEDIPEELGLTSTESSVDFARVAIGDEDFLLPIASELKMVSKDVLSRNRVRFSSCRKFSGVSALIFDDPEIEAQPVAHTLPEVVLPADSRLSIEIVSDFRPERAAVGDLVVGRLMSDVKQDRRTVAPKNAVVKGRVTRLDRTGIYYYLAVTLQEIEWKDGHADVRATFDSLGATVSTSKTKPISTPDGLIQIQNTTRTLKGEILRYRTVR